MKECRHILVKGVYFLEALIFIFNDAIYKNDVNTNAPKEGTAPTLPIDSNTIRLGINRMGNMFFLRCFHPLKTKRMVHLKRSIIIISPKSSPHSPIINPKPDSALNIENMSPWISDAPAFVPIPIP